MLRILGEWLPFCRYSPVTVSLSSRSRYCITVKCRLGHTQNILLYVLPFAAQIAHTAAAVLSSTSAGAVTELNCFQTVHICYQWRSRFLGPGTNKQRIFELQTQDHSYWLVCFILSQFKMFWTQEDAFFNIFWRMSSRCVVNNMEIKSMSVQMPLKAIYII